MWVLSHIKTGRRFYLLTDSRIYTVGRHAAADLSISDDQSVSREHARIHRSSSGVRVEDLGSKYGVYVNDDIEKNQPIAKKTLVDLQVGHIVRFGRMENTFRLENIEVKVCTSTLLEDGIEDLKKRLKVIDGVLLNAWSTECTHLIMPSVSITVKVLQSLAYGIPIVSPAFFDAYIQCAREHQQQLPNVADFVPEITEPYIIKEPNMMSVHLDRQRLFQNKTFVFMVKHHMAQFEPIISLAAGKCVAMDTNKVKKSFLCKPEAIPVHYSTLSANSQSASDVEGIMKYIDSHGRRLINESEIGLAILHRSIDRFCNPDRKMITDFEPSSANAVHTKDILEGHLISATPHQEYKDQPASNPNPNPIVIPESADLTGSEPNNNLQNAGADGSNKPSPRKSSRLSSKNGSTDLPGQLMPPPPPPPPQKQQPKPSTSKQPQKRKHAEQTSPPKSVGGEPMEQEQTSGPSKKQKTNNNDSGENSSGSAPIDNPMPPASGSQQSEFNFSGFISTQNRRNRTRAADTSQTSQMQPSRVLVHAKESRKRAVDLLNDSDDEQNEDEDNEKTFNFNRKAKRAKIMSKQGSQAKRRGILDGNDDDNDDDDDDISFNFSRKRNSERQSQAKKRKITESNNDDDDVDAATQPSQNTYKKPFKHAMNRSLNRTIKPIEFTPAPACQTDWITRKMKNELNLNEGGEQSSSSVKIKDEKLEEWEMTDEEKKRQWIKSMANVFSIRKIDVNLSRSRYAADETDNNSGNDLLNNTKNFKKFVKKNNYIPRTTVIKTHPVPVLISTFSRI